jgi:hypothetical protein
MEWLIYKPDDYYKVPEPKSNSSTLKSFSNTSHGLGTSLTSM